MRVYQCLRICLLTICLFTVPLTAQAGSAPDSFADLAEKLSPAVVNISTSQIQKKPQIQGLPDFPPGSPFGEMFRQFQERGMLDNRPQRVSSLGSGFVIDPSGYIVTNNHVIDDASEIKVIFNDKTELDAKLIGHDKKTDLALLKVTPTKPLQAVSWGNSGAARVGDWIMIIGNPFGLGGSVSAGIISARARDISAGPYDDFIQTDAAINRGNSGGPMFNLNGEVIGINTAIFSPNGGNIGIGFALPSSIAQDVIRQLKEFGRTKRGWLGVRIQPVTQDIADSLGLKNTQGAMVAGINAGGPAAKADIRDGDIILNFAGNPVQEMRDLPRLVAATPAGKTVPVTVIRNGKQLSLNVTIAELEAAEKANLLEDEQGSPDSGGGGDVGSTKALGLELSDLTPMLRQQYSLDATVQGALITDVNPVSHAAEKGLSAGDVLLELNQQTIKKSADLTAIIDSARKAGKRSVLARVLTRQGNRMFLALRLDEKP